MPPLVKIGAVVIDLGINRRPDGRIGGDVDFEAVEIRCRRHPVASGRWR